MGKNLKSPPKNNSNVSLKLKAPITPRRVR